MSGLQRVPNATRDSSAILLARAAAPASRARRHGSNVTSRLIAAFRSTVGATDKETKLAIKASRGNMVAFEALIAKFHKPVFNIALGIVKDSDDAADIAQTVFLRVFRALGSYDPQYRFFSWVYRITVNESISHLRRWSREVAVDREIGIVTETASDCALRSERNEQLNEELMRLSPDYRVAVVLKYYIGLSYKEMSDVLRIPEKTVKSRLFTARHRLRDALTRRGFER